MAGSSILSILRGPQRWLGSQRVSLTKGTPHNTAGLSWYVGMWGGIYYTTNY